MEFEKTIETLGECLEKLMFTDDVCEHFGVSRITVYRWVRDGFLHPLPAPRGLGNAFDPKEIHQFTPPLRGNPNFRKQTA